MNKTENHNLLRLNGSISSKLRRSITKTVVDDAQEGMARELIKKKLLPPDKAKLLQAEIDRGSLVTRKEVVQDKVTKEIDYLLDKKIRDGFRTGRLRQPKRDDFYKGIQQTFAKKV